MIFKFKPILKQTLWGGDKIARLKRLDDAPPQIGESWEVSAVEDSVSVVDGGPYDGQPLDSLIAQLKGWLVGDDVYHHHGERFPLLVKLIDARRDLSIQVHPNDRQAQAAGLPCGKTEMWLIMQGSDAGATLRVGLNRQLTPDSYRQMVASGTICDAIAQYHVCPGDCFFLPAGRIHSIGPGCLLLEIQQTSDVTYRIFDFNRRDAQGRLRQLHTEQAAACIDYSVAPDYQTHYATRPGLPTTLVDCDYFTTALLPLDGATRLDLSTVRSFVLLVALSGSGTVAADEAPPVDIAAGHTLLVAAAARTLRLEGQMELAVVTITHHNSKTPR